MEASGEDTERTPMTEWISMMEARKRLARLPEEELATDTNRAIAITRRGEPVLAVMSWELYQVIEEILGAVEETLEAVRDPEVLAALQGEILDILEADPALLMGLVDVERQLEPGP